MRPPFDSCATSQKVIPAFSKRSESGMNAEPMMPKACSMPCICSTFTKASSVVIFIIFLREKRWPSGRRGIAKRVRRLALRTEYIRQCFVRRIRDAVDLIRRGDQRGTEAERIVEARNGAIGGTDDHAL